MDERDTAIIMALAEHNMNIGEASEAVFMHRNTVTYHLEKIKKITGLDPRNFFELQKLVVMVTGKCAAELIRCKDCKHWKYTGDGCGDCTSPRFHIDGHADPTMEAYGFCSVGERREDGKQ